MRILFPCINYDLCLIKLQLLEITLYRNPDMININSTFFVCEICCFITSEIQYKLPFLNNHFNYTSVLVYFLKCFKFIDGVIVSSHGLYNFLLSNTHFDQKKK